MTGSQLFFRDYPPGKAYNAGVPGSKTCFPAQGMHTAIPSLYVRQSESCHGPAERRHPEKDTDSNSLFCIKKRCPDPKDADSHSFILLSLAEHTFPKRGMPVKPRPCNEESASCTPKGADSKLFMIIRLRLCKTQTAPCRQITGSSRFHIHTTNRKR